MIAYSKILFILFSMGLATTSFAAENPDDLYRQGKFAEAEEAYAHLDMENPKDIRFRYNRGCAAFQNSDFQAASAAFTSVLRRTDDKKVKYKTAYNLGNTAFKLGDFNSALRYFSQAIQLDPENKDAQYNLELALRELKRQKELEKENREKQSQKDPQNKEGSKDQLGDEKPDTTSEDKAGDQDKESDKKQDRTEEAKERKAGEPEKHEQNEPEDLSGDLETAHAMPDQKELDQQEQSKASLDRKKAEALLDNLKEDRTKFMRFQIPKDKRDEVDSGKDW